MPNERLKATEGRACFQASVYVEIRRGSQALASSLGALALALDGDYLFRPGRGLTTGPKR
jgi:hypothetical protein